MLLLSSLLNSSFSSDNYNAGAATRAEAWGHGKDPGTKSKRGPGRMEDGGRNRTNGINGQSQSVSKPIGLHFLLGDFPKFFHRGGV